MLNISKNQLEELYINKNFNREICAKLLNTNVNTIKRLCKHYDIKKSKEARCISRKQTCMERYGVEHISKVPSIRKKSKTDLYGTLWGR